MRSTRLSLVACGVLIVGLWLPWAKLSVGLFGDAPGGLGAINGQEIGSGVLDLPVGWIAAGAGVVGAIGIVQWSAQLVRAAGVAAVLVTGYTLLAIPGKEVTMSANGQDISDVFNGQVDYAWGLFALSAAAVVVLVTGIGMGRAVDDTGAADAAADS